MICPPLTVEKLPAPVLMFVSVKLPPGGMVMLVFIVLVTVPSIVATMAEVESIGE